MELATQIIGDSAFGCAGQRCLAVSVAVTIGDAQKTFRDSISHAASSLRVGNGLGADVQMGPVISKESKQRVESLIAAGVAEGAKPIVDGRNAKIPNGEGGNFIKPTILDGVPAIQQINAYRNFWSGIEPGARGFHRRRHEIFAQQSLWQPGLAFYHQWRGRKKISLRSASGKYRHQHWRGRAHGVLPIQRMER